MEISQSPNIGLDLRNTSQIAAQTTSNQLFSLGFQPGTYLSASQEPQTSFLDVFLVPFWNATYFYWKGATYKASNAIKLPKTIYHTLKCKKDNVSLKSIFLVPWYRVSHTFDFKFPSHLRET